MNNNQFLITIRQYATLAARKRTSYASQVNQLLLMRQNRILNEKGRTQEAQSLVYEVENIVMREYAPYDHLFVVGGMLDKE